MMRFQEAMNSNDFEAVSKAIDDLVEPEVLFHAPVPNGESGAAALKRVMAMLHRAFPDLHIAIEDVIAEGDKVVARNTVTGTHRGQYMALAPTGRTVRYDEIFICRFANGRITEIWGVVDVLSQMKQLGAVPA
jgi:steroid delta-isomerase-like uncharacterized protein